MIEIKSDQKYGRTTIRGCLIEIWKRELSDMGTFTRILRSWKEDLRGKNKNGTAGVDSQPAEIWE